MEVWFNHRSQGVLTFDPQAGTKNFDPWWALLAVEADIPKMYAWFLKKHGIETIPNKLWGPHISVIKGTEPPDKSLWGKEFKPVTFWYTQQIRWDNGKHAWLDVWCPEMNEIRESMGLPGKMFYHMTIGQLK